MCGIAGFVVSHKTARLPSVLRCMTDVMVHRGPDDRGFLETRSGCGQYSVGLGHRRLSIIDLHSGHQPMGNEDGSVQVVFNGEIYNFQVLREKLMARGHKFKTASDTEVIVHAYEEYGEQCVERFCGMFAFAIWDARHDRLFIARDRFGKKPLFFCLQGHQLLFASEIKSLLQYPGMEKQVDLSAVWEYFAYRYVPGPRTLFRHIEKLMPGYCGVWEKGRFSCKSYYIPPDCQRRVADKLPDDPVGLFRTLLDDAVRTRMISDVPFGAFLSGGIDSSAVVALMSKYSSLPVKTFSAGFSESKYSELGYARKMADRFETEHNELIVTQKNLMDELPALVRFRDAPVAEPSDIPIYLLSKEANKTVKMVLTGEGSDEFLGGYPKHIFERYVSWYQYLPLMFRCRLIEPLVNALPYKFRRAKIAIHTMGLDDWEDRMARWFGAMSPYERATLVRLGPERIGRHATSYVVPSRKNSSLRKILFFDQTSWLPDNLLERGDRMTMAASLEARMPFLDHQLVNFVSSLPDNMRVRRATTKWILREAMKGILPKLIIERSKVGFHVPVNEWFRGPMRDYLYDILKGPSSHASVYYNQDALEKVLSDHVRGRQNHEKLLWCLLNLEIWHRQYSICV